MQNVRIANIVIAQNDQAALAPGLFCKSRTPLLLDGHVCEGSSRQAIILPKADHYDFVTYFNSFSNLKWLRYTNADQFYLHMETQGASYELRLAYARQRPYEVRYYDSDSFNITIPVSEKPLSYDIPLPRTEDVIIGFTIRTDGQVRILDAGYCADIDESDINEVELSVCITTFKKEEYVIPNIQHLEQAISTDRSLAEHMMVHVVDNGRTIDAHDLESFHVHIHPNDNAGGSGGFARGMIESMEQTPRATHVLLMDDDVSISPESIFRTFQLLRLASRDYRSAIISGACFEIAEPSMQYEDIGFIDNAGTFQSQKGSRNMSRRDSLIINETFTSRASTGYAGWWYCAIPMTLIDSYGLPLPLFVRVDDVEYSIRCNADFITMNGICIWHEGFDEKYRPVLEKYQVMRNMLIANATSGVGNRGSFLYQIKDNVRRDLKGFNYTDAMLVLDAFEDYLKGPEFIMQPGMAERKYLEKNSICEKFYPLEKVESALGIPIDLNQANDNPDRSSIDRALNLITFNGQRMPYPRSFMRKVKDDVRLVPNEGWGYPAGQIHGAELIVCVDAHDGTAAIRKKDIGKFNEVRRRYKKLMNRYKKEHDAIDAQYREKRASMSSVEFWKRYLQLDGSSS